MLEEKHSNETLTWTLMCFFNAQPKMEEEFGSEMAERQRLDLLNGLKRQKIPRFSLRSIITIAAMRSQNSEAAANPIETFERLIGEKLENIAAS